MTDLPKLRYVLIMPVWGDHHTGLFLRYCVPFLHTEGNVGAFGAPKLQVQIFSRRSDIARMRADDSYRRLAERADVVETEIDGVVDLSSPYRAMTECYLNAVRALPDPDRTVTIFPTPDCILSRNALRRIVEKIEAGWRAVMVCGLRTTRESVGPVLDEMLSRGNPDAISEDELTAAVLNNLHPITLTCDVTSNEFMTDWPSHVYWIDPERHWLVAHCFHLHPLAVRGVPKVIDVNTTIDGDYLTELGVSADQLYVVTDSDELICAEISPTAKRINTTLGRFSLKHLVRFAANSNFLHRAFFPQAIRWMSGPDVTVPRPVVEDIDHVNAAVSRGSTYEDIRARLKSFVWRTPPLFFLFKCFIWTGIRLRRIICAKKT